MCIHCSLHKQWSVVVCRVLIPHPACQDEHQQIFLPPPPWNSEKDYCELLFRKNSRAQNKQCNVHNLPNNMNNVVLRPFIFIDINYVASFFILSLPLQQQTTTGMPTAGRTKASRTAVPHWRVSSRHRHPARRCAGRPALFHPVLPPPSIFRHWLKSAQRPKLIERKMLF